MSRGKKIKKKRKQKQKEFIKIRESRRALKKTDRKVSHNVHRKKRLAKFPSGNN